MLIQDKMEKIIHFIVGDRHKNTYLKPLKSKDSEENNFYLLKTDIHLVKVGYTISNNKFLSLSSGLIIMEGSPVENGQIIKSIEYNPHMGYIVELKDL